MILLREKFRVFVEASIKVAGAKVIYHRAMERRIVVLHITVQWCHDISKRDLQPIKETMILHSFASYYFFTT